MMNWYWWPQFILANIPRINSNCSADYCKPELSSVAAWWYSIVAISWIFLDIICANFNTTTLWHIQNSSLFHPLWYLMMATYARYFPPIQYGCVSQNYVTITVMSDRTGECDNIFYLLNRDLNHGCLVYIFSLRFSGSKFLINLRRQFCVRKIFRVHKIFCNKVLRDLQSYYVFKITISKMCNLCCRLLFY